MTSGLVLGKSYSDDCSNSEYLKDIDMILCTLDQYRGIVHDVYHDIRHYVLYLVVACPGVLQQR